MKKHVFLFLLTVAAFSCKAVVQIDSLRTDFFPKAGLQTLETSVAFDLYLSDTITIQNITVKLSTNLGASDIAIQSIPMDSVNYLLNPASGAGYWHIPVGSFLIIPPYVEIVIVITNGQSYTINKQIVD